MLSEHYLTSTFCVWVEFCCYASTGRVSCPLAGSCIYPSLPPSSSSFFCCWFPPLLFYLKAKHLRVRVWMFLVLLQLWQKGFLLLVTCLLRWTWGSCKNTLGYCPLKMDSKNQKAETATTPWLNLNSKVDKLLASIFFPSSLTSQPSWRLKGGRMGECWVPRQWNLMAVTVVEVWSHVPVRGFLVGSDIFVWVLVQLC